MEVIESIEECVFTDPKSSYRSDMEGYKITTNKQTILVGISSGQSCCEDFGYFVSEDGTDGFVGERLLDVNLVDSALNVHMKGQMAEESIEDCIFVNFETSAGTFQLAVYNEHNGYYGHTVIIQSEQAKEYTVL